MTRCQPFRLGGVRQAWRSGAEHPLAKPFSKFFLADIIRGYRLDRSDGIRWIEAQTKSIIGKEESSSHPRGAFVAVGKSVTSRQSVGVCRS
jgi:hypothetical protein